MTTAISTTKAKTNKSSALGFLEDTSATPVETAREGVEVIRTFSSSAVGRTKPKVVYGYAYRCVICNGIWNHRVLAYRHDCEGVTVMGVMSLS